MRQQNQPSVQPHLELQADGSVSYMHDGNIYGNTFSAFDPQHSLLSDPALQVRSSIQESDIIDDVAFERAFDAAHSQMEQYDDHMQQEEVEAPTDVKMAEQLEQNPYSNLVDEAPRIGSDRIHGDSLKEPHETGGGNDAEELARTAGQLLDNLKHDQSQKFQESNFLSLMRQLRDREVRVEGDKLVEVSVS